MPTIVTPDYILTDDQSVDGETYTGPLRSDFLTREHDGLRSNGYRLLENPNGLLAPVSAQKDVPNLVWVPLIARRIGAHVQDMVEHLDRPDLVVRITERVADLIRLISAVGSKPETSGGVMPRVLLIDQAMSEVATTLPVSNFGDLSKTDLIVTTHGDPSTVQEPTRLCLNTMGATRSTRQVDNKETLPKDLTALVRALLDSENEPDAGSPDLQQCRYHTVTPRAPVDS